MKSEICLIDLCLPLFLSAVNLNYYNTEVHEAKWISKSCLFQYACSCLCGYFSHNLKHRPLADVQLKVWWDLIHDPNNLSPCHSTHALQDVRFWDEGLHCQLCLISHCRGSPRSWSLAPPYSSKLKHWCPQSADSHFGLGIKLGFGTSPSSICGPAGCQNSSYGAHMVFIGPTAWGSKDWATIAWSQGPLGDL